MKQNKGFTLIELLVVISIIGLLSSIVVASLNSARVKAQNSVITTTVRQYVTAIRAYQFDKGKLPMGTYPPLANGMRYCLGRAPNGSTCLTGQINFYGADDPVLNSQLDDYYQALPSPNQNSITYGGEVNDGSLYFCQSYSLAAGNERCTLVHLYWHLKGAGQNCVLAGALPLSDGVGATRCQLTIAE
ncbi:type II secretion system GspH family protein [Candidatus Parcubacteria bacterium]|nr:type II secretion system GspH family protein [Candidatus Parcubacteria bacterium]